MIISWRTGPYSESAQDAAENGAGLLEATDVVEVEPLDLKKRHPIQT